MQQQSVAATQHISLAYEDIESKLNHECGIIGYLQLCCTPDDKDLWPQN